MLKTLPTEMLTLVRSRRGERNLRVLLRFFLALAAMILVYSSIFHFLMLREGQSHSWMTGFYWTLTVMSTLGFGDITFDSDLGRVFSIAVLLSGMIFLLVLFPFTFIEFFYQPWMQSQAAQRAPRELPADTRGHVIFTNYDAVTAALIRRLEQYEYTYALLVSELDEALRLHDLGVNVVVGNADDPDVWRGLRVEEAALVATTASDVVNTNVAFTVSGVAENVPVISTATDEASVDVLELAGSDHVLQLEEMIGKSFARRAIGGDALAHVIGEFDDILIAESCTHRTPLVGKTLRESNLREKVGVAVVGVWERGVFQPATRDTMIHDNTILVLAGSQEQLYSYDELFCIYNVSNAPTVILGGGRVGRATARHLAARDVDYRIVERLPERVRDPERYVVGNAADLEVLQAAQIDEAPTVIITPHDDDLNVYLTIYVRRLRPDVQIISRATRERNVSTLHRAGADIVMSYATMGASTMMNLLQHSRILTLAEGLDIFRVKVPNSLAGVKIVDSSIRDKTGCSVVGVQHDGEMQIIPGPDETLPEGAEVLLIGSVESEERFLALFGHGAEAKR